MSSVVGVVPGRREYVYEPAHRQSYDYEGPQVQGHLPRLVRVIRPPGRYEVPTYRQQDAAFPPQAIDYHQQHLIAPTVRHHPNVQVLPFLLHFS